MKEYHAFRGARATIVHAWVNLTEKFWSRYLYCRSKSSFNPETIRDLSGFRKSQNRSLRSSPPVIMKLDSKGNVKHLIEGSGYWSIGCDGTGVVGISNLGNSRACRLFKVN
jgi:hypothetical protein